MKKILSLIFLLFFLSSCIGCLIKYDTCRLLNIFEENTYTEKHLFSSYERDPLRICGFSILEEKENLKNFSKIDEEYFKNDKIKFAFENLDDFIKDEAKEYTDEEKEFLKNMKNLFLKWEKDEEILYNFFYIYDNFHDFEICYYKKSENKGYCIVNHM